jgi:hypothetical protein
MAVPPASWRRFFQEALRFRHTQTREFFGISLGFLWDFFGISLGFFGDFFGVSWGFRGDIAAARGERTATNSAMQLRVRIPEQVAFLRGVLQGNLTGRHGGPSRALEVQAAEKPCPHEAGLVLSLHVGGASFLQILRGERVERDLQHV